MAVEVCGSGGGGLPAGLAGVGQGLGSGGRPLASPATGHINTNANSQLSSAFGGMRNCKLEEMEGLLRDMERAGLSGLETLSGLIGGGDADLRIMSNNALKESANVNSKMASIVVRNLPYTIGWQDLKDFFRCVGDVQFAEILMDGNKKSKGVGFVRFKTYMEAVRAVELKNGTRLLGRSITVSMREF